ncbi:MAG: aldo/keto reductase [Bacteroidetes bacterium]|nr:MAG: aldo/keto reductase [Bacteroidota bacterium]
MTHTPQPPYLIYGCMRIAGDQSQAALERGKTAVIQAYEQGFRQFDLADIYGNGACEALFGQVLREVPGMRQDIRITSKCGIRKSGYPAGSDPGRYDFSQSYMLDCVTGSLRRMNIEYLDTLLLHRPDYLMDPEEVAGTFEQLRTSGKVRAFGISNFRPSQVTLLSNYCSVPLVSHQVEINIHNISAFLDGTLDQCQELKLIPEAWGPLGGVAYPARENTFTITTTRRIFAELDYQSEKYGTENWIIVLAWLLKHPSMIRPVIGTTNPERITKAREALEIDYARSDWYRLLEARNGMPVP